jgi:hypothetical protein
MLRFLFDPQFLISSFIAIVAPLVVYLLELRNRTQKRLSYDLVSVVSLLSIKDEIKHRVKILVDDRLVDDIYIVVINLINSGNVPIANEDYERPLNLNFRYDSKIISADFVSSNRSSLKPEVYLYDNKVYIEPILLNTGDVVTLKVLLSKFEGDVSVDARIVGVECIEKYNTHQIRNNFVFILGLSLIVAGIILANIPIITLFRGWPIFTLIVVGMLIVVYTIFRQEIYIYTDDRSYTKHRLGNR